MHWFLGSITLFTFICAFVALYWLECFLRCRIMKIFYQFWGSFNFLIFLLIVICPWNTAWYLDSFNRFWNAPTCSKRSRPFFLSIHRMRLESVFVQRNVFFLEFIVSKCCHFLGVKNLFIPRIRPIFIRCNICWFQWGLHYFMEWISRTRPVIELYHAGSRCRVNKQIRL